MRRTRYVTKSLVVSISNLSLYSLYYAEACYELAEPIFLSLHLWATQLLSKKCRSGGEPLTAVCSIWPAKNVNLRPPATETNALPLNQLPGVLWRHLS